MAWHENEWIGELERGEYAGVLRPPSRQLAGRDGAVQGGLSSTHSFIYFTLCRAVRAGDLLNNKGLFINTISSPRIHLSDLAVKEELEHLCDCKITSLQVGGRGKVRGRTRRMVRGNRGGRMSAAADAL